METPETLLRRVVFEPYRHGPTFTLTTWDCGDTISGGKFRIGYRLSMYEEGKTRTVFEGEDFGCSPMHAIDSDDAVVCLMGFLTLRPGDTDPEYFDDYTAFQLEYADQHAEALSCEVSNRFEEVE